MNSKERVLRSLNYEGYDRMPTFYKATPEVTNNLIEFFNITEYSNLECVLGVDFKHVYPDYIGPMLKTHEDGSWDGFFGERYANIPYSSGTYPEAVYLPFKDVKDPTQLEDFVFPTYNLYDYSSIKEQCISLSEYAVIFGGAGTMDFINGIARCRGMEQVLFDVALEDPIFLKLIEKRHEFYYGQCQKVLESGDGLIDILYIGEDFGSQTGLLISPQSFNKIFAPYLCQYIDLAHKYGAKIMMHCCGSVVKLIPRFIELGLDILDVVQIDAKGMDIRSLHNMFYGKIAFRGSMSVQSTLPHGTVDDVKREVELRKELFREGGMIIGPTHSIQPKTPIDNIIQMYRSIGSLRMFS